MRICIEGVYYHSVKPDLNSPLKVRNPFKRYYEDLVNRYSGEPIFCEMASHVVSINKLLEQLINCKSVMAHIENAAWVFRPCWGGPLDPDYCSLDLYCKESLRLHCNILDINDVGCLCQFVSLELMLRILKGSNVNKVAMIALESAIHNLFSEDKMRLSEINFVGSLSMIKNSEKHGIEVIDIVFDNNPKSLIDRLVAHSLNESLNNKIQLLYRKTSTFSWLSEAALKRKNNFYIHEIVYPNSSGFLIFCLNKILLNKKTGLDKHYLIIDQDSQTSRVAGVLLKY